MLAMLFNCCQDIKKSIIWFIIVDRVRIKERKMLHLILLGADQCLREASVLRGSCATVIRWELRWCRPMEGLVSVDELTWLDQRRPRGTCRANINSITDQESIPWKIKKNMYLFQISMEP